MRGRDNMCARSRRLFLYYYLLLGRGDMVVERYRVMLYLDPFS